MFRVTLTQQTTDNAQLQPMLERVEKNLGQLPAAISADSGFWSPDRVAAVEAMGVDPHVDTGRESQTAEAPEPEAEAPHGTPTVILMATVESQEFYASRITALYRAAGDLVSITTLR